MPPLRRLAALLAAVCAAGALKSAPAPADDPSLKSTAQSGVVTLAQKERAAQAALSAVKGRRGVPKARAALRAVRVSARSLRRSLAAEEPSSRTGERAQTLLVDALGAEVTAYRQLDRALAVALAGDEQAGAALVAKARRALATARRKATVAGRLIAALAP